MNLIHNPNITILTTSGSQYSIDEQNKTLMGGKLSSPVQFISHSALLTDGPVTFLLINSKTFKTSAIKHIYHSQPIQNNTYVCKTQSGSEYIVDMDRMTISGGHFGNNQEKIINPNFQIDYGVPMKIWTDTSIICTSPITEIYKYEDYIRLQNMDLNNDLAMDYEADRM